MTLLENLTRGARLRGGTAVKSAVLATLVTAVTSSALRAQQPGAGVVPLAGMVGTDATVGSAAARTLSLLRLAGVAGGDSAPPRFRLAALAADLRYNSGRAVLENDGGVWQGRGATASVSGGIVGRVGPLDYAARPLAFATQNLRYYPWRTADSTTFRDPRGGIDLPWRFGNASYAAVLPGESWLRLVAGPASLGVSSSTQQWGPAHVYNLVLGAEASGLPRLFVAGDGVPIGIGRLSGTWMLGRLEGSRYSAEPAGKRSRMMTAVTASWEAPGALRGLMVGGSRFFHVRWTPENATWENALLPLRGFLKASNSTGENGQTVQDYNQLGSVFARVAPPGSGVEVYGEFYREDHNWDLRDAVAEPDHQSAWVLGMRRARPLGAGGASAVTVEVLNARYTHLARVRSQGPMYVHGQVSEGHTYLGQALGSSAALGGGGMTVRYERVEHTRATLVEGYVRRTMQTLEGGSWDGEFAARLGARISRSRSARLLSGWLAGVDQGLGEERGVNFTLGLTGRFGG